MKTIRIVYCETCHDAMLYVDGEVVRADRLVSSQIKHGEHEGRSVTWELP